MRDRLVDEDPKSAEILKPVLRGRDIERYQAMWAGKWLIDTHNGYSNTPPINVDLYPTVKSHLNKHFERLEKRLDKGITPYNLRNCAYHDKFFENKIIWREIGNRGRFYFDNNGQMILQTAFFITGEQLPYICCFLNSKLPIYFMQKTSTSLGESFRWLKYFVESIPLPKLSLTEMSEFKVFVEEAQKKAAAKESNIDNVIEEKILQHYHLSNKEIETIKGTK